MSLLTVQGAMLRDRGGDPHWASVAALLHFDGANLSTVYADETGRPWTGGSGAAISTAQSVFGGASVEFSGLTNTAWVQTANSSDFDFGADEFTIECWFRPDVITGAWRPIISKDDTINTSNRGWLLLIDQTIGNLLSFSARVGTTTFNVRSLSAPALSTWHFVAAVRDKSGGGDVLRLYLNGVQQNSVSITGAINAPAVPIIIGNGRSGANYLGPFDGHIDEVRVTNGVCRYPGGASFSVPSRAFRSE